MKMVNNFEFSSMKSGIIEYINVIITIISKYIIDNNLDTKDQSNTFVQSLNLLNRISNNINDVDSIEELLSLKDEVVKIDQIINFIMSNKKEVSLSSRELALIDRGYTEETVKRLALFDEKILEDTANIIYDRITTGCEKNYHPNCIFLGGQPGCGKSSTSFMLKNSNINNGIVEIGIDNYRTYHPNYLEIESVIRDHWKNRQETPDDTPGNDIADFTHNFAGKITDLLIDKVSKRINGKSYNIVLEWGMRTPEGPLNCMKELKEKGYNNIVNFIAVDKETSLKACKIRADVMNNQLHIVRRVPNYFHEMCIKTLPDSCQEIYNKGFIENNYINDFVITNRDGRILWDKNSPFYPKDVYHQYLNNPSLSNDNINDEEYAQYSYIAETHGLEINKNKKR